MKRLLCIALGASALLAGFVSQAVYKSRIYIINKTDFPLAWDGKLEEQKGDKIEAKFKTKAFKGSYKKFTQRGYTCKVSNALAVPPEWKCTLNQRRVIPGSVTNKVVSRSPLAIAPGKMVRIAEIDRDQPSLKSVNWSKLVPNIKNPNPDRLRPALLSRVYPYEQVAVQLQGPYGKVYLVVASERVGLSNMMGKSIAAGSIGGLGMAGGVVGVGAGAIAAGSAAAVTGAAIAAASSTTIGAVGGVIDVVLAGGGAAVAAASSVSPYVFIGGLAVAGLAAAASIGLLAGLDQRSGLAVVPVVQGNYTVSQSSKLRFGNLYKDIYLTVKPKKK